MKKYESLAQLTIDEIRSGKLPVGTRLPALRVTSKQHFVSITTATNAYRYLEETGWISAIPQSGFFVSNRSTKDNNSLIPQVPGFQSVHRDPKSYAPIYGYNPTVDFFSPLGTSMISPDLLPTVELQRSIKRVTSRSNNLIHQYPTPQGNPQLRSALADHFRKDHFAFKDSDLLITSGCINAIQIAIEVTSNVGDTIAISSPCFSGLLDLLTILKRNIIEIPSNDQGLNLDRLEKLMKTQQIAAALFNTSHMNPSGTSLCIQQKQQLANLANKYTIPIIEDDVYIELSHYGKPPLPTKYWDKGGYILWCGSVSKTLAAGLRLGWCLPGRYFKKYLNQHKLTGVGVSELMQASFAEFINTNQYRSHINKVRLALSRHIYDYRQFLIKNLPANTRVSQPEGGTVLWVQIPQLDANKLQKAAKEQLIDIRSGSSFSTHKYYKDCFRINCGWPLEKSISPTSAYQQIMNLCKMANFINR